MTELSSSPSGTPWHRASYRHALLDLHVGDWDPAFLSQFDPKALADTVYGAGIGSVMIYFQAHTGLCYWPTTSGKQHNAFAGEDMPAQVIKAMRDRGIRVCAYYSVNFNNWGAVNHPEWRLVPALDMPFGGGVLPAERYGICCLNNPGYRNFLREQAGEIVAGYDLDGVFFDMLWWQTVCVCEHCQARFNDEAGHAIPATIDWYHPIWCAFQEARERWLIEMAHELRDLVKQKLPDAIVYHNFATAMMNWAKGVSFESAKAHDFLGGDFYGGREEQLVVSRLMTNLTPSGPAEFMTTVAANLAEHVRLQPAAKLEQHVLAASACGASFLMIAALNADGTAVPEMFERVGRAYDRSQIFEPYLGGKAMEDVAVYFSSDSKMNFAENGRPLAGASIGGPLEYPHFEAVRGACVKLQRAHLPFGVITRSDLDRLSEYKLVILPNVLRMTQEEVDAFRAYVEKGGRLYASRETSLTESGGCRHADFLLADIFGCSFAGVEEGRVVYAALAEPVLIEATGGQRDLSHWNMRNRGNGAVRLDQATGGDTKILATLKLPYAYPEDGAFTDQNWACIHCSPPWQDAENPVIVEHAAGVGRTIYSAADIEAVDTPESEGLFIALVRSLIDEAPSFEAETHPCVWMTGFDQESANRTVLSFLNYQEELPVIPIADVAFRVRLPSGRKPSRMFDAESGRDIAYTSLADGRVSAQIASLHMFSMIVVEYS